MCPALQRWRRRSPWRLHALQPGCLARSSHSHDPSHLCVRRRIIWLSSADPRRGYACDFPTISMHAVAAPSDDGDKPCLYLQLASGDDAMGMMGGVGGQQGGEGSGDDEGSEGDDELLPPLPELRLVPADADQRE